MSGTRTTTSRGLSGVHRIVWATFVLGVAIALPARTTAQAPAAPAPPVPAKASKSKPAVLAPLPLFPLRLRWAADLEAPPSAGIANDDRRVFVPLTTGGLIAVDVDNGAVVWRSDVVTTVRPAVADDHVYVVGGDALHALDVSSGRAAWRVALTAAVSAPVVARSGWVIAALESGEVIALRGADGTEVWRQQLAAPVVAPPAIDGDRLYLPGADGTVRALSVATGTAIWTQNLGGSIVTIAPLGGRVYLGSTDNHFYCLDDKQGRVRWRWRAGSDPVGAPIADDERVYFTSLDTVVRALDRGHGAQRWRQPLPWRPRTGPLRVGNTLVASGIAVDLRGYAMDTGSPVGDYALTENRLEVLEGTPVVIARAMLPGDFLVAAIADGRLVALEHVFGLPARPLTDLPGERMALTPPPPP
ncbi:PQQ-binding-like beta-propeller repeat protein [Luteitalea pratensis]|uniref:outer membrane protein assembly factor BamB family protein n=1 Tax=Luteitalea pratensis TaxID=1855912 RepID=UPI00138FC2E1|nr:PQQ-binding-like beta-propeller repeat protein [Luteitalea pratensis]